METLKSYSIIQYSKYTSLFRKFRNCEWKHSQQLYESVCSGWGGRGIGLEDVSDGLGEVML